MARFRCGGTLHQRRSRVYSRISLQMMRHLPLGKYSLWTVARPPEGWPAGRNFFTGFTGMSRDRFDDPGSTSVLRSNKDASQTRDLFGAKARRFARLDQVRTYATQR